MARARQRCSTPSPDSLHCVTVLIIEHSTKVIMSLSHRVILLNNGLEVAEGAPIDIRRNPAVIAEYSGEEA